MPRCFTALAQPLSSVFVMQVLATPTARHFFFTKSTEKACTVSVRVLSLQYNKNIMAKLPKTDKD